MLIFQKCFSSSRDKKTQLIADLKENLHAVLAKNNLMLRISNFDLELILDESITNAMEHGNNWDPTKKVCVKMELYDEELILFVEDEGEGFNYNSSLNGNSSPLEVRGRGIPILKRLCDVQWLKGGAVLKIILPVSSRVYC